MTGGDGFLGWHTQCSLRAAGIVASDIPVGEFFDAAQGGAAIDSASRLIHLAGVNRGTDDEVSAGNALFAQQIADTVRRADQPPATIVYANSIQSDLDNVYGRAKAHAADILSKAASDVGAEFIDVRFPNLYGEHGRPFYNSVTATFCHLLANGGSPEVKDDKELALLHAQDAADVLVGAVTLDEMATLTAHETVSGLLRRLSAMAKTYSEGQIPDIAGTFDRNLFNTYRSFVTGDGNAISLSRHVDPRGAFVEMLRSHGGRGQASFSTTVPGITRGNHFHRRKVERFVVMSGRARISMRRLLTDEALHFDVDGDAPIAVDMPTMWTHNVTNTGTEPLFTFFWTDDLFDPERPDTTAEDV